MSEDRENQTIRLLQEMRVEMREGFADVIARLDGLSTRTDGMTQIRIG